MAAFYSILTTLGAAALALRATGSPVLLATMVLGDGNGAAVALDPGQTALVNQVASVALDTVEVDPIHTNWINIKAVVPADIGGFTVREVGLKLDNGQLFTVGKFPDTYKPAAGSGQELEMVITVKLAVSSTADIQVTSSGLTYATQGYVQSSRQFFACNSVTATSPPGGPNPGDTYVIPVGATGAWTGLDGKVAYYMGVAGGWLYIAPKPGSMAATDTGLYRLESGVWQSMAATDARRGLVELATSAEVITGTDADRAVTPAGLSARTATDARTGLVELATSAEVITGTDADRAVTPAGLSARTATDARTGLVELATVAEAVAGVDTARAVTPAGMATAIAKKTGPNRDAIFLGML